MADVFAEKSIVECAKCGQRLRVPADRGTVKLRCPKCRTEFEFAPPVTREPLSKPPVRPTRRTKFEFTPPLTLQANGWFDRGMDLFESKRYEEALVCFREALRLRHPHAERAIARCQEKLGRTAHERLFAWGEKADDIGAV
jgi:DNA-directed RNA polymerase subunit M/transcription elongation factor TFIIS